MFFLYLKHMVYTILPLKVSKRQVKIAQIYYTSTRVELEFQCDMTHSQVITGMSFWLIMQLFCKLEKSFFMKENRCCVGVSLCLCERGIFHLYSKCVTVCVSCRCWSSTAYMSSVSKLWTAVRTGSKSRRLQHLNQKHSKYNWTDARWLKKNVFEPKLSPGWCDKHHISIWFYFALFVCLFFVFFSNPFVVSYICFVSFSCISHLHFFFTVSLFIWLDWIYVSFHASVCHSTYL